jgi:hypothetical protein
MYCGNNKLDPKVISGDLIIGNRYECLQKGIGKGLTLPSYNNNGYDPINREQIYCGKSNTLPRGYDRFGSNSQCFQKGVGVGKSLPRQNQSPHNNFHTWSNNHPNQALLLTFILIVMVIILSISVGKKETLKFILLGPFSGLEL